MLRKRTGILAAAFVTVILGAVLSRIGRAMAPWRLLYFGLMAFVSLNIIVFTHNLFKSLLASVRSKDQKELEDTVAPAMQGDLNQLSLSSQKMYGWLTALCLGEIVGAIVLLILRHYKAAF